jgi:PhzF family phenazine biosynthesis protein
MMNLYQVDAFTDVPFRGNPAGVCILEEEKSDQWMIELAREMNLSETAYLYKQNDTYPLRWFTPKKEVALCGHATLASAHILWEEKIEPESGKITFETKNGKLYAYKDGDIIKMDFPARLVKSIDDNAVLNGLFDIMPINSAVYEADDGNVYLLEVVSENVVKQLEPDFQGLIAQGARGVIVTSKSNDPKYDFISRYFAPKVGVNEDPVTGSAHCCLAPYWGKKLGKIEMVGFQASERSGVVMCEWKDDRVVLGGKAVTVFKIEVMV